MVERVVAVVDGQPIFASELVQRAAPEERALEDTTLPAWRRASLRRRLLFDVLQRIVEERLTARAARAQGLTVSAKEVDDGMAAVEKQQGWSRSELETALAAHGLSLAQYRRRLSAQLLERKLLAMWVNAHGRSPSSDEEWVKERKRWLAELRDDSFIELRLPR
jgi:parvulin-like peptidyl-prolyl isomerase